MILGSSIKEDQCPKSADLGSPDQLILVRHIQRFQNWFQINGLMDDSSMYVVSAGRHNRKLIAWLQRASEEANLPQKILRGFSCTQRVMFVRIIEARAPQILPEGNRVAELPNITDFKNSKSKDIWISNQSSLQWQVKGSLYPSSNGLGSAGINDWGGADQVIAGYQVNWLTYHTSKGLWIPHRMLWDVRATCLGIAKSKDLGASTKSISGFQINDIWHPTSNDVGAPYQRI